MFESIERLKSGSGADLALRHQQAVGEPKGVLQICHGLAEHSGRYEQFARAMAQQGFAVYAHDHRGHGNTKAADAPIGRFAKGDGVGKVIADVTAVTDHAKAAYPDLPIFLFGHSMGGLIALNTAVSHPRTYSGIAIWNTNFAVGAMGRLAQVVLKTERALKGSDVPSLILPKLTFETWGKSMPDSKTQADWLSRDRSEVEAYEADPLCGFDVSISMWLDVFELTFRGTEASLLSRLPKALPFHLVGGGQDPATEKAKAIDWLSHRLARAGFTNIHKRIYPLMRHETLKEIGREEAMQEFSDWMSATLSRPTAPIQAPSTGMMS
ncbi:alpha/beta hydrolase [Rhizobium rhizoryzae]|uniref:alpha/beta hydrolase n=1 Tax=Rhizobium rhizoryzae TaxID=451876 RepID=UPI00289C7C76|nr:alpha/beta hydrolase [Rhizobium rhizoryzae]